MKVFSPFADLIACNPSIKLAQGASKVANYVVNNPVKSLMWANKVQGGVKSIIGMAGTMAYTGDAMGRPPMKMPSNSISNRDLRMNPFA